MENLSQNAAIRRHLEAGNSITPLEALDRFNCLRLGARIHNLKADGLPIRKETVEQNGKRFARYSLAKMAVVALVLFTSCVSLRPGSLSQRHRCRVAQDEIQNEHCLSAGKDWTRPYRNWHNRPQQMTRIPFTNLYIP